MTKSIVSFIIIIFIAILAVAIIVVAARSWFLLDNKPKFITGVFVKRLNIALIKPTFTGAAYHMSFYKFYFLYASIPPHARKNVTTDLNLLSSKVSNQTSKSSSAFTFYYLPRYLKTVIPKSHIEVLTDADVDYGSIFLNNETNKYDVIILGHQEYVTQREYDNLKHFVANGGTLILMDGNVLYVEVKYNRNVHTITLIKGHGWAFNGESARRSVGERWANETSQWIGSNYLCYSCNITFANNPFHYKHHEEQYLTNPNDRILMDYKAYLSNYQKTSVRKPILIATYVLNYQKGKVVVLGIYSDDIITNSKFDRYFDGLLMQYTRM